MRPIFSFFIFLSFAALAPMVALAARFSIEPSQHEAPPGESFELSLLLDTEGEAVNAMSGEVAIPPELSVIEIRTGMSIVNFWIEPPRMNGDRVRFSGITPGGFTGKGTMFSLVMKASQAGRYDIPVTQAGALLNDGEGTPARVVVGKGSVSVRGTARPDALLETRDTEPPESFVPLVGRDDTLFDGAHFVAFVTQDKISGIDHYEIAERRGFRALRLGSLPWVVTESPYLLADQELKSHVYVKAVDKRGNMRIETIPPREAVVYKFSLLFAILILSIAALLYARMRYALFR